MRAQIRDKAQERIGKRLYEDAKNSNDELITLGNEIKDFLGCDIAYGPLKAKERALQKVTSDYKGDWFELKDVVRLTIIAKSAGMLKQVRVEMRKWTCRGLGLIKDFEATEENSACGYSGLNFVVRLSNDQPAEIQANILAVMYGQLNQATFCAVIGEAEYRRIKSLYNVQGGLGHGLYEIYRVAPASPNGLAAKNLGRKYFHYLRGNPNYFLARDLTDLLTAYRLKNAHSFH